jgi:hypothetical protein
MNLNKYKYIIFSLAIGDLLLLGWFWSMSAVQPVYADSETLFVATGGSGTTCSQVQPCTLQTALDQVDDGDTVYLAQGTYTGTGTTVISITKSITLAGGWDGAASGPVVRDPVAHPTTLDAQEARRGMIVGDAITVTLEGFTVTNGVASDYGAGLYARNVHLTLRGMIFYNNNIPQVVDYAYGGGAMVEGGTLLVKASTFRANSAQGNKFSRGGGLAISGTLGATIEDSVFHDNVAWGTGGLYFTGPIDGQVPFVIRRSRFTDNGWRYDGAMEVRYANIQVEDCVFAHNQGLGNRGAISTWHSTLLMARNVISGNRSGRTSALHLYDVSPFTITNNVIVDNQSTYDWTQYPAVTIDDSVGHLLHNTIARNSGAYGILVSHTVGISVTAGCTANLDATLWGSGPWANGVDWGGSGDIFTGTLNVWGDPAFVAPDSGDYHIGSRSAAIDRGVDAGVSDDVDGDSRPLDGDSDGIDAFDIGADEAVWWRTYLPLALKNH